MMRSNDRPLRVLAMVSGGQDGELAARVLEEQGAVVERVHFETGFVRPDRRRALGLTEPADDPPAEPGARTARVVDVRAAYLREVVVGARHGYGRALDACLDCRMFLARRAGEIADEGGADIIVTGDVIGQQPRAQSRRALERIASSSGDPGRLLHPLSARRLDPIAVESDRRVDRDRLHAAHGRGRVLQRRLGEQLGVPARAQPGGGCCLLADRGFALRLRDLLAHRDVEQISVEVVDRLRVGRHFRIAHGVKAIVARDAAESRCLARDARNAGGELVVVEAEGVPGAVVVVELDRPACDEGVRARAASLAVRYSRSREETVAAALWTQGTERIRMTVAPASETDLEAWRI